MEQAVVGVGEHICMAGEMGGKIGMSYNNYGEEC